MTSAKSKPDGPDEFVYRIPNTNPKLSCCVTRMMPSTFCATSMSHGLELTCPHWLRHQGLGAYYASGWSLCLGLVISSVARNRSSHDRDTTTRN